MKKKKIEKFCNPDISKLKKELADLKEKTKAIRNSIKKLSSEKKETNQQEISLTLHFD